MSGQDERRIERLREIDNGQTLWKLYGEGGGVFILPPGILPTLDKPKPLTRKVVQQHCVLDGHVHWTDNGEARTFIVEWELCGDKIVAVRLLEGDDE